MSELLRITSKDNRLIKRVVSLQTSSRARKESGLFVLEGLRLCRDAAENGYPVESLFVSDTAAEKYPDEIETLLRDAQNAYRIPDALYKKMSDTVSPQGILCLCRLPDAPFAIDPNGLYVALERVADPSNVGAVARTAEALGIDGILLSSDGCDPFSPKALRASMGALLRIPVAVIDNLTDDLRAAGLKSYAAVVDRDAKPVDRAGFHKGSVVLIGNEANGLLPQTAAACDEKITIPMAGKAESLNAAAAASIILWEMCRQI